VSAAAAGRVRACVTTCICSLHSFAAVCRALFRVLVTAAAAAAAAAVDQLPPCYGCLSRVTGYRPVCPRSWRAGANSLLPPVSVSVRLQLLSKLTKDPDAEVRKVVCDSLISLMDRAGTHILPQLQPLTEFFLNTCQSDPNPEVVLSACEYWSVLSEASAFEDEDVREYIISLFPR
jgi:hypothetical protein